MAATQPVPAEVMARAVFVVRHVESEGDASVFQHYWLIPLSVAHQAQGIGGKRRPRWRSPQNITDLIEVGG